MKKQSLKIITGILLVLGIILFFIPDFKLLSSGLFVLGFSCLMYAGYKISDKKQRSAAMIGVLVLMLIALYKLFNGLSTSNLF